MARLALDDAVRRGRGVRARGRVVRRTPTAIPISVAGDVPRRRGPSCASTSARSRRAAAGRRAAEVCVTFSHIRPQPGIGYDERRYINLWGPAEAAGDRLTVPAARASGWDEADIPFFEYAERSVPDRRTTYMEERRRRAHGCPRGGRSSWPPGCRSSPRRIVAGRARRCGGRARRPLRLGLVAARAASRGAPSTSASTSPTTSSTTPAAADAANVTPTPFSGGSRVIQYGLVSRRPADGACVGLLRGRASRSGWCSPRTAVWWLLRSARSAWC